MNYYDGQIITDHKAFANWTNSHGNKFSDTANGDGTYTVHEVSAPSEEEIKSKRIAELERLLASKDYIGTKIATRCATVEDYAEEIAQCEEWRKEIRELKK